MLKHVLTLLQLLLGLTFLLSGLAKLRLPYDFLAAVCDYQLFGPRAALAVAALVPWIEIFLAVCLLGNIFVPGAFLLAGLLSTGFVAVVSISLYRQLNITCGCFLANDQMSSTTLLRSCGVFSMAWIAFVFACRRRKETSPASMRITADK